MKSLAFLVLLSSAMVSIALCCTRSNQIGEFCCDAELSTVRALGCGDYVHTDWMGCSGGPGPQWWCNYKYGEFGTECTGSEMCPMISCVGAPNSYCYAGYLHSGLHCSTVSVPCCTITYQCADVYHYETLSTECGCKRLGTYVMGSRTVGTAGGSCTGGGPSPNPTGVIDPTSVIAGDPA